MIRAKEQLRHRASHLGRALHRQVGLGRSLGQHLRLGSLHTGQHRDATRVIEIDANRQVDLVRAGVLLEGLIEAEDGVARVGLEVIKETHADNAFSMSLAIEAGVSVGA